MSETLWAQVARDLTAGITSGRYPVGSLLPTELDLCAQYGTSRHTMRTAIRQLQDRGLISRNKKAGTRVESAAPLNGYRQSLGSLEDLIQFGAAHVREVQDTAEVMADEDLAAELGCTAGSRWFRISSLRLDGRSKGTPIGWTDVYLDPAYADLEESVRASPDVLISTLIEQRYDRISVEIRQDVEAIGVPEARATALKARADTPAIRVLRHYRDAAGKVFEISSTIHPAGRFTVSQRMRRMNDHPSSGAQNDGRQHGKADRTPILER